MALLDFEGFDHMLSNCTDLDDYAKRAGSFFLASKVTAPISGSMIRFAAASQYLQTTFAAAATIVTGFKFHTLQATTADDTFIQFYDSAAGLQCGLSLTTTNRIILWRGSTANIIATSSYIHYPGIYTYIELKITFDNSGTYELKINGVTDFSGSADTTNTANNNCATVRIGAMSSPMANHAFDDWYVLDTSGSAPYNDFLGVVHIETQYPTSANATAWTPNASTNVSRVSDTAPDDDTTYNATSSSANVDTFNHGSISAVTPATVYAVAVKTRARKDDATVRQLRTKLISGATTSNGASNTLATSYANYRDVFTADPDTAAVWTTSGVNSTKIGYEHV